MPYPITIGATNNGTPIIGAKECKAWKVVAIEKIYPSQMRYRVVAKTNGGKIIIETPTSARESNHEILNYFPAANGSLSRYR